MNINILIEKLENLVNKKVILEDDYVYYSKHAKPVKIEERIKNFIDNINEENKIINLKNTPIKIEVLEYFKKIYPDYKVKLPLVKNPLIVHPDMGDSFEEEFTSNNSIKDHIKNLDKTGGLWLLKQNQYIGYNGYNSFEVGKVLGFISNPSQTKRKELVLSTPRGLLFLDPLTSGEYIVDIPENLIINKI